MYKVSGSVGLINYALELVVASDTMHLVYELCIYHYIN